MADENKIMKAKSPLGDEEEFDFQFKFILIGETSVGKSSLVYNFLENKPMPKSQHTVGVDFGSRVLEVGGRKIRLMLWDTAGHERFRGVTRSYYNAAIGAVLVYDITSRETFDLEPWLKDLRSLASPHVCIILVGNKCDLSDEREISFLEASRFAVENEILFLETSALDSTNVNECFYQCSRKILNRIETGAIDPHSGNSGIVVSDHIRVKSKKSGGGGDSGGAGGGRAQESINLSRSSSSRGRNEKDGCAC